jgi:hypothetical protein
MWFKTEIVCEGELSGGAPPMVGPTPEDNLMNLGRSRLHNDGKISTTILGDKRNFSRKRTAEALDAKKYGLDADFADERGSNTFS